LFIDPPATHVREFMLEPDQMVRRHLPELSHVTGEFRVIGKVGSGQVYLCRVDGNPQPGVVLIGDAFQSACPSMDLGLGKVLTNVHVRSKCIPRWLATPGMGIDKLADFYNYPSKLAADSRALRCAHNDRCAAINPSLQWQIHRFLLHLEWQVFGSIEALRHRLRAYAVGKGVGWLKRTSSIAVELNVDRLIEKC
jgi:hypothetical protein